MSDQFSNIEYLDKKRMRYLELYLIGVIAFIILSITRYFFRLDNLNDKPIGIAVLVGLVLSLCLITLSTVMTAIFWHRIKDNSNLKHALNNEFIQSLGVKSWKAAYLGAVGATLFFAISGFFYPVCDSMLIALTSIITGAGAYQATLYFKYRAQ